MIREYIRNNVPRETREEPKTPDRLFLAATTFYDRRFVATTRLGARARTRWLRPVDALLASGSFDAVASALDTLELERGVDEHWPWAAHVLGHLARNDLELARVCFERAPESATRDDATKAAFAMVQCARARDFAGLHEAAASPAWSSPAGQALAPLLKHVVESQSARARAIHRAYTTVSLAAARGTCRCRADAKTLVETHGWVLDERANVLQYPLEADTEAALGDAGAGTLTDHVIARTGAASAS